MSTDAPLLPNPETLPDDPAFLKQLIVQLFESLHKEQARVAQLEQQIHLLIKRFLRPASEKFDPNQLPLFDTSPDPNTPPTLETLLPPPAAADDDGKRSAKPGGHGRRRIPDTLEQRQVIHDLTPEQKLALGGQENLLQIGEVITRQYEWEPSCIFVIEHHQLKYVRRDAAEACGDGDACKAHDQADTDPAKGAHTAVGDDLMLRSDTLTPSASSPPEVHDAVAGELSTTTSTADDRDNASSPDQKAAAGVAAETATLEPGVSASSSTTRLPPELAAVIAACFPSPIVVAPKPPTAIPGGEAGPGLLAQTLVGKYADHVPLYRWERIFERHGVRFSRQTTCDWCARCADLFQPLTGLICAEVLGSFVIHTDDTPVNVRDAWAKAKFQARFWTYVGDEAHPLTWFDFTTTHQRAGPDAVLAHFRGYLQADGYGGYDDYEGLCLDDHSPILKVACWTHARRKFHDALRTDRTLAEMALARIAQLYALEKELRRRRAGQWQALPLTTRAALIAAERQSRARPILRDFRRWLDEQEIRGQEHILAKEGWVAKMVACLGRNVSHPAEWFFTRSIAAWEG